MDPKTLRASLIEQINSRINLRNDYATELEQLRGAEQPDDLKIEEVRSKKATLDSELTSLRSKLEEVEREIADDDSAQRLSEVTFATRAPSLERERSSTEVTEKREYSAESDPQGLAFMRDVASGLLGNSASNARLERHMTQERHERGAAVTRAIDTGGVPGLVIPQYLVDLYTPKGRPGRKFADQCRKHPLPASGREVYIPRQVSTTAAGEQVNELEEVTEQDYEDEMISVRVRTAAGSQTISRQAVERGLGVEDIVMQDLFKSYDVNLDSQLINSPVWGLLAVANSLTYTDADPTAAELYRKILGAAANIEDVLQDLDEDDTFTLMRGRRWAWLQGELTDKWPFIAANNIPALVGGVSDGQSYQAGVRGHLPNGGDVVTDNNLPSNLGAATNQDPLVIVARQEAHLWEDPSAPVLIRAEHSQVKKLAIDFVVYGYFAACFDRVVDEQGTPKAVHQKITGTGLVPAVF